MDDKPKILIETKRLQMREFCIQDAVSVLEFSTHPEVTKYTGDEGIIRTIEDAKQVIEDIWISEYKKYGYARYALIHKRDKKLIGFCGIKYEPDILGPGIGCPDIGYRILPHYWGQGLGTEAVRACLHYAREELGLTKIIGEVDVKNVASNKLLKKLGFSLVEQYQKEGSKINRYE